KALAEALKEKGFRLVSDGTDNHLILIDLRNKGLTGKEAEEILEDVGIATNKNTIPFDPESPFITSGIRIGTPAVTTRGMKEKEMEEIADIISLVLHKEISKQEALDRVNQLCHKFPLY
ncbi:MAG TPA: serine hydroxymethyltransferase, partial [Tissierellaceae bacterium]|nr:serine hydroxymethyltransferase [Tissierellaceae bacterium]